MQEIRRAMCTAWTLAVIAVLSACGGGGGGGDDDAELATLSEETVPSGARVDVSGRDYFPVHQDDTWVYEKKIEGVASAGVVTRKVSRGPDVTGLAEISESDGSETTTSQLRLTAAGVEALDPLGAINEWPGAYAALPSYTEYPTPFYSAKGTRRIVRQGALLADVDGDAEGDYFRLEITQVFEGFEPIDVLGTTVVVAHFKTSFAFTVSGTKDNESRTVNATEETYFADGLGLVRADRSITAQGSAVVQPYRLELRSATVNRQTTTASGRSFNVHVEHSDLVYDATRRVYLASVASSDPQHSNRIATIDPAKNSVTYSAPVGSGASGLAVSKDGRVLYVGLEGSGEIVKLALPSMTELARVRLPVESFEGQVQPEDISVSPASNDVIAVSMKYTNLSPRHAGVALMRDMVLQPRRTQGHTGSNRIAFSADGRWLYGYNNETTEFGLRRIEVVSDGLIERNVTSTNGTFSNELAVADGMAVIGNAAYGADASLALLGTVASAEGCAKLPGVSKLACHSLLSFTELVIVDSTTFSQLSTPAYADSAVNSTWRLVPGPVGQVGISEPGRIIIFSSRQLE